MKKYELAIKKTYKEDNKNLFKSRKDYGRCPVDFRPVDRQDYVTKGRFRGGACVVGVA